MAAIKLDNLQGDVTILKSGLEGLGIAIYDNIKGPLRSVTQTATEMWVVFPTHSRTAVFLLS